VQRLLHFSAFNGRCCGWSLSVPPPRTLPDPDACAPEDLEVAIHCAASRNASMCLLAMKTLLLAVPFETVMKIHSVCERTLQRWVADYNGYGIGGLTDRERTGRPPAIPRQLAPTLARLLEDLASVGLCHWTGRKFHGYLRERLKIEVAYSTTIRFLHKEGFALKVPQPWPDRQDEAAREAFCRQEELLKDGARWNCGSATRRVLRRPAPTAPVGASGQKAPRHEEWRPPAHERVRHRGAKGRRGLPP